MLGLRALVVAAGLALAAVCCAAEAPAAPPSTAPPVPPPAPEGVALLEATIVPHSEEEPSLQEQQYRRALEIRDTQDATYREVKQAVKLLYAAAGILQLSMERPTARAAATEAAGNATAAGAGGAAHEFLAASAVKLVLRNDTAPHQGALKELIYIFREGDGVPVNPAIAHRLLLLLAELGHAEAQADVAFHLALGVEPVAPNSRDQLFRLVPPDVPAALIHYTFAAKAGDPVAQMSLGYRHLHGVDVPKSCQAASMYYAPVAEKVLEMAQQREGLPQIKAVRLSYKTAHTWRPSTEQEVLHYQWFADFGNVDAARAVAHMLSHGAARDLDQAMRYLRQAADAGDADAMAHLGHIYANGLGVTQDNSTAMSWFWKAAGQEHAGGYFGLGYMYLSGHGTPKDYGKALKYLKQAVQAHGSGSWGGSSDTFFYLGLMHLNGWGTRRDTGQAITMWETSSRLGHMLASYNLAMLHLGGHTKASQPCQSAVGLLKKVAEKGFPAQQEAHEDFQAGDYEWALLNFLKAAEMGVELGQSNAAWMLTEGYGYEGPEAGQAALVLYKRAAQQGNTEALLRIGDGYWYGKGVPRDWRRAAQMYNEAGKHHNAQALFNMGFMHQYGVGLPKDFHLAKRFYDRSVAAQPEASMAVQLALAFLRLHIWWEGVEPRLPKTYATFIGSLFTLADRSAVVVGESGALPHHHSPSRHGVWARLRHVLSLDFLFDALDNLFELGDNVDLTVALGLLLLLALVLWRRRMLRNQHLARQFVQAQPGGPRAIPRWAQPAPADPQPQPAPAAPPVVAPPPAAAAAAAAQERAAAAAAGGGDGASGSGGSDAARQQDLGQQGDAGPGT